MAFIRERVIKGRIYIFLEIRWREGGKVRSKSKLVGKGSTNGGGSGGGGAGLNALDILPKPGDKPEPGWSYIERQMEKYPGDPMAQKAADRPTHTAPPAPATELNSTVAAPAASSPEPAQQGEQSVSDAPGKGS